MKIETTKNERRIVRAEDATHDRLYKKPNDSAYYLCKKLVKSGVHFTILLQFDPTEDLPRITFLEYDKELEEVEGETIHISFDINTNKKEK